MKRYVFLEAVLVKRNHFGESRQKYGNVDQMILYDVVGTSFDNIVSK